MRRILETGYLDMDNPAVTEDTPRHLVAPTPDSNGVDPNDPGMCQARWTGTWDDLNGVWIGGSWVDEQAAQLAADLGK